MKTKELNCGCILFFDTNDNLIGFKPHAHNIEFDYVLTSEDNVEYFDDAVIIIPKWALISLAPSEY